MTIAITLSWQYAIAALIILMGVGILMSGFQTMRKRRLIQDTPTSKIRSMAMGIVEVNAAVEPDTLIKTPFSKTDCVYYRFEVKEYRKESSGSGKNRTTTYKWQTVGYGDKRVPFFARDDTGRVLVNPEGAEVSVSRQNVFYQKREGFSGFGGIGKMVKSLKAFAKSGEMEFDTSEWNLIPIAERKGISTRVGDRKYYEFYIQGEDNLYILGTAANSPEAPDNILIKKGKNEKTFLISDKDEKEFLKSTGKNMIAAIIFGTLFFTGGVVLLLHLTGAL